MRRSRIRLRGVEAHYHCVARVVAGEHRLGAEEKEVFRRMLERAADFSGIEVLTFVVMSNHYHLLVKVPRPVEIDDAELVRRFHALYRNVPSPDRPSVEGLDAMLKSGGPDAEVWRKRLRARMHDVSEFVKTLNQRFAVWYNRTHNRFGTFWAERFKSLLVEGSVNALTTVAAYIDLNPVRAGLVGDPAEYRWGGYSEAIAGAPVARQGIATLLGDPRGMAWGTLLANYRQILFGLGARERTGKASISAARVRKVIESKGRVSRPEALRCRMRYFSDGAVLGSAAFVAQFGEADTRRRRSSNTVGPHPLRGADWEGLSTLQAVHRPHFQ